jgi:filamentous hemagglutinin family protein
MIMKNPCLSLTHTSALSTRFLSLAMLAAGLLAAADASALPQGSTVVSGHATITQPSATQEVITQTTNKAIINWQGFDIQGNESVHIIEPSSHSIQLDRVTGGNPTQILGSLTANGQVWLVNPDGIFFGPSSQVNVAGLVASTADISNRHFRHGHDRFDTPGKPDASVINDGTITAARGGLVALVAPGVINNGVITAKYGTVALGAGQTFSIDFYGDGLYGFDVTSPATQAAKDQHGNPLTAALANTGTISAGTVNLTARAAANIVSQAINTTGIVEATAAHAEGGTIVLDGGDGNVNVGGTVDASRNVRIDPANVSLNDATVTAGHNIHITTPGNVTLTGSTITAGQTLDIDNGGAFSSDTPGVLNGNTVRLHQNGGSAAGSIQNAIDAVGTVGPGGTTLKLGDGTWNEAITISDPNFRLIGSKSGNSIIEPDTSAFITVLVNNVDNVTISDLTVQPCSGCGVYGSFYGIAGGGNNMTILGNHIGGFAGVGLGFHGDDDKVAGNIITGAGVNADQVGIGFSGYNNKVYGNSVSNYGIDILVSPFLDNTGGHYSTGNVISKNLLSDSNTGISIQDGINTIISGNTLTNVTPVPTNPYLSSAILVLGGSNTTIEDNSISGTGVGNGIGAHFYSTGLNVSGNAISDFATGVSFDTSTTGSITNNTLAVNATGISLTDSSVATVSGNTFTGDATDIYVDGTSSIK